MNGVIHALTRSLNVFHLAGSACNNCDIEILDALTPKYDLERFGITLVGSIRHADLVVSLLSASENALRTAFIQPNVIWIYALAGEYDTAVDQMEYLLSVPSGISAQYLRVEAYPASLREHPRFQALLERYGN